MLGAGAPEAHGSEDPDLSGKADSITRAELKAAADAFRSARRVTAICHENPDADTVGAAIAAALIAQRLGAEAEVVSADGIPATFAFLPYVEQVRLRPALEPDLAVVCDAASLQRVGRIAREEATWFSRARLLNIDHHISNNRFGDLNLVDPHAAATCEVLAGLVGQLDIELDADLATALLTGIVRDSQGFSDRATSGRTLRAAARLVDAGASLTLIHRYVLGELTYPTMALWGKLLADVSQTADGRVVYTVLTQEMLEETGTQQHDADGVVEFMARARGTEATLLLRQLTPSEIRVSIRTTGAVDAAGIAAVFGGGGHKQRAGYTITASREHALNDLLSILETTRPA
jgi:bifunctional oligoribonuclease and PAP phosphatase NrnA